MNWKRGIALTLSVATLAACQMYPPLTPGAGSTGPASQVAPLGGRILTGAEKEAFEKSPRFLLAFEEATHPHTQWHIQESFDKSHAKRHRVKSGRKLLHYDWDPNYVPPHLKVYGPNGPTGDWAMRTSAGYYYSYSTIEADGSRFEWVFWHDDSDPVEYPAHWMYTTYFYYPAELSPSPVPSVEPTLAPTAEPTIEPTPEPTPTPTPTPSVDPTPPPTPDPTPTPPPSPIEISADEFFSPNFDPVTGLGDGRLDTNAVDIHAKGEWTVSVGETVIYSGRGDDFKSWDGRLKPGVNTAPVLPDGKYTLTLNSGGQTANVDVVIDTQAPTVSKVKFEQDQVDTEGNTFVVSANLTDVGLSGVDVEESKVEIKGTSLAGDQNPFVAGSEKIYKSVVIQSEPGQIITAEVIAVDKAGNSFNKNSASEKFDEVVAAVESAYDAHRGLSQRLASLGTTNSAYRVLNNGEVSWADIRDSEAYAAAMMLDDPSVSPATKAAVFTYYASIMQLPLTVTDVAILGAGFGAGKIVKEGGVIILKKFSEVFPAAIPSIVSFVSNQSRYAVFNFRRAIFSRGTLSVEKFDASIHDAWKALEDHELKGVAYLINNAENVVIKQRHKNKKSPDFLVDGVPTELKSAIGVTPPPLVLSPTKMLDDVSSKIRRLVKDGADQNAETVMIDARGRSFITEAAMRKAVERWAGNPKDLNLVTKVRLVGDGFDVVVSNFR